MLTKDNVKVGEFYRLNVTYDFGSLDIIFLTISKG
jgi:hypothetical protein